MTARLAVLVALLALGCGARSDISDVTQLGIRDASTRPPSRDASLATLDARDASVDHVIPSDVLLPPLADAAMVDGGSCGFEITGEVQASIVGTTALAVAGDEQSFMFIECQGTAAGNVYAFTAQYIPGEPAGEPGEQALLSSALQVGPNEWAEPSSGGCAAYVLIGGAIPQLGAADAVGEPFSMTFACSYQPDAGGTYDVSSGHLAVVLSAD
jgi:hypothetical protein